MVASAILRLALPLLLVPALSLALSGCDKAPKPQDPGSAGPTEAAPATTVAEGIPVRWVAAEAPLFNEAEDPNPSAERFPSLPPEALVWRLYTADLRGSPPALLYETRRYLLPPRWSVDGSRVIVRFSSKATVSPNGPNILTGVVSLDPSKPASAPAEVIVQSGGLLAARSSASPDGRTAIISRITSYPLPGMIPPGGGFASSVEVTQVDLATGRAKRLEGMGDRATGAGEEAWSPDGRYALMFVRAATGPSSGPPTGDYYLVPMTDGAAIKLGSLGDVSRFAWSPAPPYRLAFSDEGGALWIFDAGSATRRRVLEPGTVDSRSELSWWRDGRHVQVRNQVVDVNTSDVVEYPPGSPSGIPFAISPDGRYMLTGDSPVSDDPGRCPSISPPENHVYLYDRNTDQTSVLKDCDGRLFGLFDWMADSRHVVMRQFPCAACDGFPVGLVMKDIVSGRETALTDGLEVGAWPVLSADGRSVLVTGDRLRVYSDDGVLLRDIEPPVGSRVLYGAWSPDGRSFAYVLAPEAIQPGN